MNLGFIELTKKETGESIMIRICSIDVISQDYIIIRGGTIISIKESYCKILDELRKSNTTFKYK